MYNLYIEFNSSYNNIDIIIRFFFFKLKIIIMEFINLILINYHKY